jgi:hypothetical protein
VPVPGNQFATTQKKKGGVILQHVTSDYELSRWKTPPDKYAPPPLEVPLTLYWWEFLFCTPPDPKKAGAPWRLQTDYWEGWQVRDGQSRPTGSSYVVEITIKDSQYLIAYKDIWERGYHDVFGTPNFGEGSAGASKITGTVIYLDGVDLDDVARYFFRKPPDYRPFRPRSDNVVVGSPAGGLHSISAIDPETGKQNGTTAKMNAFIGKVKDEDRSPVYPHVLSVKWDADVAGKTPGPFKGQKGATDVVEATTPSLKNGK